MSRLNKIVLSTIIISVICVTLAGCGTSDISNPQTTTEPASPSSPSKEIVYKYKSPITQPTEFISQTWNKYETMFMEQSDFDSATHEYTNYYFNIIEWFREQYSQNNLYGDVEYKIPSDLVKGSVTTNNGQVITYLFNAPVPLQDTALASQIGQTVIAKVNDIATNPTKYGVEIKITSGYKPIDGFALDDYSKNNELLIYVERYAFNNIIAYSINFFVPTDNYYWMTGGGPWGASCHQGYRFGMNFDAQTGQQITWEDIFADDVDYKSEIASYQEYRSFIEEIPKTTEFNYDKMFLLTPTNILIGDDYNSVYCENKNMDLFDNRQYMEFDESVREGVKLVDIKHSERDIPLKFFKDKIAIFERYKTTDNLWENSVQIKTWENPTNTLNGWEYSD